jgi:hypothetical protein
LAGSPERISADFWEGRWARMSEMVWGCSSWMKVSRFSDSAFCRKEKGVTITACITASRMVAALSAGRDFSSSVRAYSRPPCSTYCWARLRL